MFRSLTLFCVGLRAPGHGFSMLLQTVSSAPPKAKLPKEVRLAATLAMIFIEEIFEDLRPLNVSHRRVRKAHWSHPSSSAISMDRFRPQERAQRLLKPAEPDRLAYRHALDSAEAGRTFRSILPFLRLTILHT